MLQSVSRRLSANLCVPSVLAGQVALVLPREAYALPSAGQAAMVTEGNPLFFFAIGSAAGAVVAGLAAGLIGYSRYRLLELNLELELDEARSAASRAEQAARQAQAALNYYQKLSGIKETKTAGEGLKPLSTQEMMKFQRTGPIASPANSQVSQIPTKQPVQRQGTGAVAPTGAHVRQTMDAATPVPVPRAATPVQTAQPRPVMGSQAGPVHAARTAQPAQPARPVHTNVDTLEPVRAADMRQQSRTITIPDKRSETWSHRRVSGKTSGGLRESISRTMNLPVIERATPRETGGIVGAIPLGGTYPGQATYPQQGVSPQNLQNTGRVANNPTRVFNPEVRANFIDRRIPRFDESLFPEISADIGQAAQVDSFAQALEAMDQRMPKQTHAPVANDATAEHVDQLVREEFENNRKGEPRRYSRSKLRVVEEAGDVDSPTIAMGHPYPSFTVAAGEA